MEENRDEFTEKLNAFADKAVNTLKDTGTKLLNRLDAEKQKAEVKSEIGHNARELSKAYEKLGRQYYANKVAGTAMDGEKETFDLIRSKEKLIELLNEKLDTLEK